MSEVRVFTAREAADLIHAVLGPMLDRYRIQARDVGNLPAESAQVQRAHLIGRAQGVVDAIEALFPAFGLRSPGGVEPVPAPPLVDAVGTDVQVDRLAANRGSVFGSRNVRRAS